ncbi:MAG: hypothetical protein ABR954_02615 [Dehalococcoidales bacterium]
MKTIKKFFIGFFLGLQDDARICGFIFFFLGFFALITAIVLLISKSQSSGELIGVMLGLFSVGLGCFAIDMSVKSDKRYTELLQKINSNVENFPTLIKGDFLTPTGQQLAEKSLVKQGKRKYKDIGTRFRVITEEQSKEEAQKRLDEDTQKVGFVRGEIYQLEDRRWGIHWGGKHPLQKWQADKNDK